MIERIEFRLLEEHACRVLGDSEGVRVSELVRKLELESSDPRLEDLLRLDHELQKEGDFLYVGWDITRTHTEDELASAELLRLIPTRQFEPDGESCGTTYDYSKSCSYCGAGRQQVGDLVLDLRRVPVSLDIAVSITGEWTVSRRLAELLASDYPSVQLAPIRHRAQFDQDAIQLDAVPADRELLAAAAEEGLDASSWEFIVWLNADRQNALYGKAVREHVMAASRDEHATEDQTPQPGHRYQLRLETATVRVDARTAFGSTPTDRLSESRDGATSIGSHRCPLGHTLGLNALSPLYVDRSSWDGSEIVRTEQLVGERVGVFVPRPFVLISSGVYRALVANAIKGFRVEVAQLV